jgi:hypothetical protein
MPDLLEPEGRSRKLRFPTPPGPWVWLRTIAPCPKSGDTRLVIVARVAPSATPETPIHTDIQRMDVPIDNDGYFTPQWAGYHYEAIGWLRHYHSDVVTLDMTGMPLEGRPPTLELLPRDPERLSLEAALRWQRAYKPTEDGTPRQLTPELHWEVGEIGPRLVCPIDPPGAETTDTDFRATMQARSRLLALQTKLSRTRAHRDRAFDLDQAVRIARALLTGDPPQHPTTELIAEAITKEEDRYLSESGLTARWQRHKKYGDESITMGEVLSLAYTR